VDLLVKGAARIDAEAGLIGMAQAGPATELEVREWKRELARYSMIQFTADDSFSNLFARAVG
jgi:hypothetical protein